MTNETLLKVPPLLPSGEQHFARREPGLLLRHRQQQRQARNTDQAGLRKPTRVVGPDPPNKHDFFPGVVKCPRLRGGRPGNGNRVEKIQSEREIVCFYSC